jgi:hypothetical protein
MTSIRQRPRRQKKGIRFQKKKKGNYQHKKNNNQKLPFHLPFLFLPFQTRGRSTIPTYGEVQTKEKRGK